MKQKEFYDVWTKFLDEYKEYFVSNADVWFKNLNDVKKYINENEKRPSSSDKNKEIQKLGYWIENNQKKYIKKEENMKQQEIYDEWTSFLNEYKEYFKSNDEIWSDFFEKLINYINSNKKLPSKVDKDKDIAKLGIWLSAQQQNYKKKNDIMKNEHIYDRWTKFLDDYSDYFASNEEIWYQKLFELKKYIDSNKKRPSQIDKNKDIAKLGHWLSHQSENYEQKKHIMKNQKIRDEWKNFMDIYKDYFGCNEVAWNNMLNKVIEYIKTNDKLPSKSDKNDENRQMGAWISSQQQYYKNKTGIMKKESIRKKWEDFTKKYK
jgi:hypothetical protein